MMEFVVSWASEILLVVFLVFYVCLNVWVCKSIKEYDKWH